MASTSNRAHAPTSFYRWCPYFPSYHLPLQLFTPPPVQYTGMLFPNCLCCCFSAYFTWRWFDAFYYFFCAYETSSMKTWFVLATGLAENLTQLVFREPFVIQHVRTRSLNCETWNFWCFHNIINMKIIWDLWCYCISSCSIHVISWFESQKCMNNPYHTYHNIIAIRS